MVWCRGSGLGRDGLVVEGPQIICEVAYGQRHVEGPFITLAPAESGSSVIDSASTIDASARATASTWSGPAPLTPNNVRPRAARVCDDRIFRRTERTTER